MKNKTYLILSALLLTGICHTASAAITQEQCTSHQGQFAYGNDGTPYCASKVNLNWWSAIAWCNALGNGAHLISLDECNKTPRTGNNNVDCPNLYKLQIINGRPWTLSVSDKKSAYRIDHNDGSILVTDRAHILYPNVLALCVAD